MMNDHHTALLIDLAEGTLPLDRHAEAEMLLRNSKEARRTLAELRAALSELNSAESGQVPDHYFTGFLPRLRERMDQRDEPFRIPVPWFLFPMLRPAMALAGLLLCVAAYRTFEPRNGAESLYDVVRDAAVEELASVLSEGSAVFASTEYTAAELTAGQDWFGLDATVTQSESELSQLLEEQELERVVQQLEVGTQ